MRILFKYVYGTITIFKTGYIFTDNSFVHVCNRLIRYRRIVYAESICQFTFAILINVKYDLIKWELAEINVSTKKIGICCPGGYFLYQLYYEYIVKEYSSTIINIF